MSTPPTILLEDTPTPSEALLALLHAHLPHSIAVLRHLQSARNFPGGSTPTTHILYAHHSETDAEGDTNAPFAAAFVDLARAPETQLSIYSSLERSTNERTSTTSSSSNGAVEPGDYHWAGRPLQDEAALDLVLALFRRTRALAIRASTEQQQDTTTMMVTTTTPLVGSLHETWEFNGKWLFRVEDLPREEGWSLPQGVRWDRVRREDAGVVQGRTRVTRLPETLLMLPSTVMRLEDGTPIAWAFMGLDGTLMTLHVEEPYRQRGLAKALACKLMREHISDYSDDGWGAADVYVGNSQSQALCRSIGGKKSWILSWAKVDLSTVGDPM
ncbi:uncharacterized protein B0H64DRAFT_470507 [Chaetomium fimeti]|uniref:FR47-like domain-containing protein n=1 Tax=Chaetomium fimeti TaxID=1854472 RepID=A0AAE0LWR1_9PEZI|nr:hypothetical protein B0H64DRAFT_470507 [Chaetomium fimeti]